MVKLMSTDELITAVSNGPEDPYSRQQLYVADTDDLCEVILFDSRQRQIVVRAQLGKNDQLFGWWLLCRDDVSQFGLYAVIPCDDCYTVFPSLEEAIMRHTKD